MIRPNPFGHKEFRPALAVRIRGGMASFPPPGRTEGVPALTVRRLHGLEAHSVRPPCLSPGETSAMPKSAEPALLDKWKIADAAETYGIRNWGKGYFAINKHGHVTVQPTKRPDESIDLKQLIDQLQERG